MLMNTFIYHAPQQIMISHSPKFHKHHHSLWPIIGPGLALRLGAASMPVGDCFASGDFMMLLLYVGDYRVLNALGVIVEDAVTAK